MDASRVTDNLFIAARPRAENAAEIAGLGVRLVLNMIPVRAPSPFSSPPLRVLWLPSLDTPGLAVPIWMLRRGVRAALAAIQAGDGVMAYCREGRHRSVAMACAILIGQGMASDQAMRLVKQHRPQADPEAPHIARAIRRFERSWQRHRDSNA